ncbi:MAG: CHAP domain-containing protein [Solirubrobacteraceae bacterium]
MSLPAILERIAQIDQIVAPKPPASTGGSSSSGFLTALNDGIQRGSSLAAPAAAPAVPGAGGSGALAAAQSQVGVSEQPPGSNDGPQIAEYRTATAGSGVGPWCAYFTSWAAAQAGVPLGEAGQGFGSVSALYSWAQRTGRATPAGPGVRPNPGDLIVWGGRHVGIVESVDADGSIHTIEGNSSNAVSRRTYGADGGGATGYVRLG